MADIQSRIVAKDYDHLRMLTRREMSAYGFNCNLNHIDVSRVTDMNDLFSTSNFNGDISDWDMSNVESMVKIFYDSAFNGNISKWNTAKVRSMGSMFARSAFKQNISDWNTSHVENFNGMFSYSNFLGDISRWTFNIKNVRNMSFMFDDLKISNIAEPNLYCWMSAITMQTTLLLPAKWKEHFEKIAPPLIGLGLPVLETAKFIHQSWINRENPSHSFELPALE